MLKSLAFGFLVVVTVAFIVLIGRLDAPMVAKAIFSGVCLFGCFHCFYEGW